MNEQISLELGTQTAAERLSSIIKENLQDREHNCKYIEVSPNKGYYSVKANHSVAVRIEPKKSGIRIDFNEAYNYLFSAYSISEIRPETSRVIVNSFDEVLELAPKFAIIAESSITLSNDGFGCCSRYEECSDAKKCIHPDHEFASACAYKKNLEQGKIFYGKNKNI